MLLYFGIIRIAGLCNLHYIGCDALTILTCTDFEIQQYEIEINKELQISAGEWYIFGGEHIHR